VSTVAARPFSRATTGGNPVGRPRTSAAEQPTRAARALIAAKRYQRTKKRDAPDAGVGRSFNAPGELSAFRGAETRERADWMREGAES
jgi:hypothetical protein